MTPDTQRGNVFFYIFLAIALFGALGFAVSQGGRGSVQGATSEQNRLRATEIIDYADTVSKAVGILRLRGTTLATLRFSNDTLAAGDYGAPDPANALNEVFNGEGGGVIYRPGSADAISVAAEDYKFLSGNAVKGVGTTCTTATCSDIIMVLGHVKQEVCMTINALGGVDNPSGTPPEDSALDLTDTFKGTMAYAQTIGDEAGSAALDKKLYGCFKNSADGALYFYRVLWWQ